MIRRRFNGDALMNKEIGRTFWTFNFFKRKNSLPKTKKIVTVPEAPKIPSALSELQGFTAVEQSAVLTIKTIPVMMIVAACFYVTNRMQDAVAEEQLEARRTRVLSSSELEEWRDNHEEVVEAQRKDEMRMMLQQATTKHLQTKGH